MHSRINNKKFRVKKNETTKKTGAKTTVFVGSSAVSLAKSTTENRERQKTIIMKMNNVTMHYMWAYTTHTHTNMNTENTSGIHKSCSCHTQICGAAAHEKHITIQPNNLFTAFPFEFPPCRLTKHQEKQNEQTKKKNKQVTNTKFALYTK